MTSTGGALVTLAGLMVVALSIGPAHADTTFAVIGDYGALNPSLVPKRVAVANMVQDSSWGTDFVITVGDNNYGDASVGASDWAELIGNDYGQFMLKRSDASAEDGPYSSQTNTVQNFYPAVGNHDRDATTIEGYLDFFDDDPGNPNRLPTGGGARTNKYSYYDFVRGEPGADVQFFVMDAPRYHEIPAVRAAQDAWLRDGLQNSTARWKFVVTHYPPASSGSFQGTHPTLATVPYQQWGAQAVFAGHDHTYERLRLTDSTQIDMLYFVVGVSGSGVGSFGPPLPGSEARYSDNHGAMRVTVNDQTATFELLSIDAPGGVVQDSFTLLYDSLPAPPMAGDMDGDEDVDFDDIKAFVLGLTEADQYRDQFGLPPEVKGDFDLDGDVDFDDIRPFVTLLAGSNSAGLEAVPEPATLVFASLGLLGLVFFGFSSPRKAN